MRLLSFPVPHRVDPKAAFADVYGSADHAVWLDSGVHASTGMSLMGAAARRLTASVADHQVTVDGVQHDGTVFDFLRNDLGRNAVPERAGFTLGWVGWLGYELRAQTMQTQHSRRSRYPDAALVFLDRAITVDHATGEAELLALGESWTGELLAWRDRVTEQLAGLSNVQLRSHGPRSSQPPFCGLSSSRSEPSRCGPRSSRSEPGLCGPRSSRSEPGLCGLSSSRSERIETNWAYSDEQYLQMIRDCQAAIAVGDAYQLCLTTEATVAVSPDPLATYLELRESSPTHHGAFLRMGDVAVLSASPEQFIAVSPSGEIQTSPIKGTRRRGQTEAEDDRLKTELLTSDKERAENLMIVDLMRNDIGRIAALGSVTVEGLLTVESYAQVHQLVSTVRGRLAAGVSGMDAVVSCFPAGSMTGAPKRSATEILDRLERRARGVYSGVLGYFALDGRIDLSMVIRSIVIDEHGATVGAGGGITALSVPEEELDEVYLKAAALLRVLGVAVR